MIKFINKQLSLDNFISSLKKIINLLLVLLIIAFVSTELIEDLAAGESVFDSISELFVLVCGISFLLFRLRAELKQSQIQIQELHQDVTAANTEAKRWRQESTDLIAGLGRAIEVQFTRWGLSDSERDIALLLLKGLSHKEIAQVRKTSEKTVRHQATALYRKASLDGRAQLSSFFLEDLLLPSS